MSPTDSTDRRRNHVTYREQDAKTITRVPAMVADRSVLALPDLVADALPVLEEVLA